MEVTGMRAIRVFTVSYKSIRLKVRVMPHFKDVYLDMSGGVKWRMNKELPAGFFNPTKSPLAKYTGEVVLAGNSNLNVVVPHEVFHAVLHHFKTVNTEDDEPAAYAVGELTAKILRQLKYITYAE